MFNAIGIPMLYGDIIGERNDALLKAAYLYSIPAYIYDIADIEDYKQSGRIRALFWDGGKYRESYIDLPRFTEIFCDPKGLQKRHTKEYDYLQKITVFTDDLCLCKYEFQRKLLFSPLSQYAIPTIMIHSFDELLTTASLFPASVLKPVDGRLGKGIMKLECRGKKVLFSTPEDGGELTSEVLTSYYTSYGYDENANLMLEPCLNIANDEGHAVDFRCLVSLDGESKWQNVLTYARIGSNNVASNIALGGMYCPADSALEALIPGRSKEKLEEINRIALQTAELVKAESLNPVSWLGIDICVDRPSNQVYVIEANSKPGMKLVSPWPLSLVRAQYFKYLLNQANTGK